jgi:hypothetical protein
MTLRTVKIIPAHVNVAVSIRGEQLAGHVRMLDGIPAPAVEMAGPAGGPGGMAHIFGHKLQVHLFFGHTRSRRVFFIGARGVMAHQAVDSGFIGKVK